MNCEIEKSYSVPLVKCPACHSPNIYRYYTDQLVSRIFRCKDCQLEFMNPQYEDNYLEKYYANYNNPEKRDIADYQKAPGLSFYLSKIEKYCNTKNTILDYGCGDGRLLYAAGKTDWKNLIGYDVD